MHNITFSLGDPWCDGHGHYSEYHMQSNYSADEIQEAYKKACNIIGLDFVNDIADEYECDWFLDEETTNLFLKHNLIDADQVTPEGKGDCYQPENCFYFDGLDDYLNIFKRIVQLILPDFTLTNRDLEEENLSILDGAAYGLFHD